MMLGGVGMTRSLKVDTSTRSCSGDYGALVVKTTQWTDGDRGMKLISTAHRMIPLVEVEDDSTNVDGNDNQEDGSHLLLEAAMSILDERRFSEYVPTTGTSLLKFSSLLVASDDDADECAVMAMESLEVTLGGTVFSHFAYRTTKPRAAAAAATAAATATKITRK